MTTTQPAARTGNDAQPTEADVRAWLAERANQVLMRNGNLISAKFQMSSESGEYSVWLLVRTSAGIDYSRFAASTDEAEVKVLEHVPTPASEAARLRSDAANLLATAARLEQSTAA